MSPRQFRDDPDGDDGDSPSHLLSEGELVLTLTSPPVDATAIAPNLFVGSRPPPGVYHWLGVIVLCAKEYQPPSYTYPGVTVLHVPLSDDPQRAMLPDEVALAVSSARTVARYLQAGQRVLVTCHMGLNRSALVAALTLHLLEDVTANEAIQRIRAARGPLALRNRGFRQLLRQFTA